MFYRVLKKPMYWKLIFHLLFVCLFELLARVPAFTFHQRQNLIIQ